ncbi:MAG: hypothetical protein ACT4QF_20925 [Sporichthyaceae bacterium]
MHVYSSDDNRGRTQAVLALLAVLLAIGADAAVSPLDSVPGWLVGAPTVAAAYGLLHRLVDTRAWRWRWIRALGLVDTPCIEGVYEGQLVSSYQNTTIDIRLQIEQRWTGIGVRLEVLNRATSTSRSIAAAVSRAGHHDARLTYTYKNEIRPGVADPDMGDHDGTADLVIDPRSGAVSGRYFNARGRSGTMTLTAV